MKIAIIGDMHGHLQALQMALTEIRRLDIDRLVNMGDIVNGSEESDACVDLLRAEECISIRGNHDEYPSAHISPNNAEWLRSLPTTVTLENWVFTHINHREKQEYIKDEISAWNCFDETEHQFMCVGHTHIAALYECRGSNIPDTQERIPNSTVFKLDERYRYLLVNPSLGYNRRLDRRPMYSLLDTDALTIELKPIDIEPII